ncbi:MAG: 1-acyl-sn-glycerol-3-phosphate acyltransferase [Bacilli bacterium]|nr:1-acyl-sn-glycerol-3-phosphate acyltransferase [Bacilli bacterium]
MKEPFFYRFIARPIIRVFIKLWYHPTVVGIENIPRTGRVVLAGNHTNDMDSVMMVGIVPFRVLHFLAKDSLLKGAKKLIFRGMGIIPVNRAIHDKNALESAINALEEDKSIAIFPEGTINRTDDIIMPFKIGAVKMASETNTPIVPFVITGKYKFGTNDLRIEFLKPIKVSKKEDLTNDNKKLEKIISDKLQELRNQ